MLDFASKQTYAYLKLSFFCKFILKVVMNSVTFQRRVSSSSYSTSGFGHVLDEESIEFAD